MKLIAFGLLIVGSLATAGLPSELPYSTEFKQELAKLVGNNGPQPLSAGLSHAKIDALIARLSKVKDDNATLARPWLKIEDGKTGKKLDDKVKTRDIQQALGKAIRSLEKAKTETNQAKQIAFVVEALELFKSTQERGERASYIEMLTNIYSLIKPKTIPKSSSAEEEATNLLSKDGKFLSVDQIAAIKISKSDDLSRYNPPTSPFWKNPGRISAINIEDNMYSSTSLNPIQNGIAITFPQPGEELIYDSVRRSESSPKINVKDQYGKKFKLKFGPEINTSPTVQALEKALGFPADTSKYYPEIRLNLGSTSVEQMKGDWQGYFGRSVDILNNFDIELFIKDSGVDQFGNNYVVFKEGLLTADDLDFVERLGKWSFDENSHNSMREVRALALFNMWVMNVDVRTGNNTLAWRKDRDTIHMFVSDVGRTLGFVIPAQANVFLDRMGYDLGPKLLINYANTHNQGGFDTITLADARWMGRLIGQLTAEQIAQAVKIGVWHDKDVQALFTNKLIARRNSMMRLLGLSKEFPDLISPYKARNVTEALIQASNDPKKRWYANFWGNAASELLRQAEDFVVNAIKSRALDWSDSTFHNAPNWLSIGKGAGADIIWSVSSKITANPIPRAIQDGNSIMNDNYIFQEEALVGVRGFVGTNVAGALELNRRYFINYPVDRYKSTGLLDWKLTKVVGGFDINNPELPSSYTILREDMWAPQARILFEEFASVVGFQGLASPYVSKNRNVIRKFPDGSFIVYQDNSTAVEAKTSLFADFLLNIPFLNLELSPTGSRVGKMVGLPASAMQNPRNVKAVNQVISDGHFEALYDIKGAIDLNTQAENFLKSNLTLDAFIAGFSFYKESSYAELNMKPSEVKVIGLGDSVLIDHGCVNALSKDQKCANVGTEGMTQPSLWDKTKNLLGFGLKTDGANTAQLRAKRGSSWKFISDEEIHETRIYAFGDISQNRGEKTISNRLIQVNFLVHDRDGVNQEVNDYLHFMNGITAYDGSAAHRIAWEANADTSRNGHWGEFYADLHLFLGEGAIAKLLSLKRQDIIRVVAQKLGVSEAVMTKLTDPVLVSDMPQVRKEVKIPLRGAMETHDPRINWAGFVGEKLGRALDQLDRAQRTQEPEAQLKAMREFILFATITNNRSEGLGTTAFDPTILASINTLLGDQNILVRGGFYLPTGAPPEWPDKILPRFMRGGLQDDGRIFFLLNPTVPIEVYHWFDRVTWVN